MDEYDESCPSPPPPGTPDLDPEWAEYVAQVDREMAADRDVDPEFWASEEEPEAPRSMDPESLDPDSWGPSRPSFGQGRDADVCPPGPLLAGLTEQAVTGDLGRLSDSELVGVLLTARRQVAREQYKQVLVTAEYGRRRQAAFEAAAARGVPVGCRPGGFPGEELAAELLITRAEAGHRIDDAIDLTSRLPLTLAGMAAGLIDEARAGWIALYTRSLTPADAATADQILAAAAPGLTEQQLARKAAALEMKLNPEGVRARREHARRSGQRVEARRELSGNAALSGREMDTADVMASKAHLDAVAGRLRAGGLAGSLGALRVLALADLTQGRNPLDRLTQSADTPAARRPTAADAPQPPGPAGPQSPAPTTGPQSPAPAAGPQSPGARTGPQPTGADAAQPNPDAWSGWDADDAGDLADESDDPASDDPASDDPASDDPAHGSHPGPLPALINLIVPAGTLLGWSSAPAEGGAWGLLDSDETRTTVSAAARHPRTRWCVTLSAPDGSALAHACARGQHPQLLDDLQPQPPPAGLAELLRRLNLTFAPIARGSCDHAEIDANADAEEHYTPSRKLRHLIRARTATCDAPGCQAQATSSDLDHTTPWPAGQTDQCNLAPRCRRHHRAKQAPDWRVVQLTPGVARWTLPSGRTHTTTPTRYDV